MCPITLRVRIYDFYSTCNISGEPHRIGFINWRQQFDVIWRTDSAIDSSGLVINILCQR